MTPPTTTSADATAMQALRLHLASALQLQTAAQVLHRRALVAHLQPIVDLRVGEVMGHESLIRGPEGSPLRSPDALFRAARQEHLAMEMERACLKVGVETWAALPERRRLFLNLSAGGLVSSYAEWKDGLLLDRLARAGIEPSALVIEITEHEYVNDMPALIAVADALRPHGLRFALDDFGDGRSSLRLWAELQPEFVKIDKYFIRDAAEQAVKVQTLKGLTRLAETFGTSLIAEGIETESDLMVARDLGIRFGQGYLLGRPQADAQLTLPPVAVAVLKDRSIAVLPELTRAVSADLTAERLAVAVPPVHPQTSTDELAQRFSREPHLRAVAVLDAEDRPLGLIHRQGFLDRYARPYFREIFGKRGCLGFANTSPLILDKFAGLEAMTHVLTADDQRYLTEGFIVTDGGRYLGLGSGEALVRTVTEVRIEAARHANPLTFLPGNIPISQHMDRLLASGAPFVACYADLNDFKPFNDHYGYWRGDEMIRLLARTLLQHVDPRRDFVGHVGGDDFVVLFQSDDWPDRCARVVQAFNEAAVLLFDEAAQQRGGIDAEDRYGVMRFFGFTTLALGVVRVAAGSALRHEAIATAAATAKHEAKVRRCALYEGGLEEARAQPVSRPVG